MKSSNPESKLSINPIFPSDSLIKGLAPLTSILERPDLLAHQSPDVFALWLAWEKESGKQEDVPYWAIVWPAARLLAHYLGKHPTLVAQKDILDLGCGGGLAGIAALKAGAQCVVGNDIDSSALTMAARNAIANRVELHLDQKNLLLGAPDQKVDVILVGDMFYDRKISEAMLVWLNQARNQGTQVYIADASRPFAPKRDVSILHEELYLTNADLEGRSERMVRLLAYRP